MKLCPPMADASEYRTIYYEFVFNGVITPPKRRSGKGGTSAKRAAAPVPTSVRNQLAAQVAADRDDPRKAELKRQSIERAMARQLEAPK